MIEIDDFPPVAFKIGKGETKSDRSWLKKKKEYFEKMWSRNGTKILSKIEGACGDTFTDTSKKEGIVVLLHKKSPKNRNSYLKEDNPLEINLFLTKNDPINAMKQLLVRMLAHSFIQQQYEFHFRIREQTMFEDILADEFVTSMISFSVLGRKLGRANCAKALDEAIEETVYRLSQKATRNRLVDVMYSFSQEYAGKSKNRRTDILEKREELITKLLKFLPKAVGND
ncbi:MAG: hypothetical protein NWF05_07135 [Candidatus Bathyarchaeota archaeon]|nr:hypothetical protein [Candidatus Bathyarchaeota archaeon]